MNLTSLFGHFLSMIFGTLSFRFSPFSGFLLFGRHAFYTVNTMVFTHSALAENLISALEKNENYQFFD